MWIQPRLGTKKDLGNKSHRRDFDHKTNQMLTSLSNIGLAHLRTGYKNIGCKTTKGEPTHTNGVSLIVNI